MTKMLGGFYASLSQKKRLAAVLAAQATANMYLLVAPGPGSSASGRLRGVALCVSVGSQIATRPILRMGSDGADQMTLLVQGSNAISRFAPGTTAPEVVVSFQSLHLTLSYAVAGWVKLLGQKWRNGTAVEQILRTQSYGSKTVWELVTRYPALGRFATLFTVAWESLFPLVHVLPTRVARPMAGIGIVFHLVNGYAMGLWRFVFAFGALYPSLWITLSSTSHRAALRRLMFSVAMGAGGVGVAVFVQSRIQAHSFVHQSREDCEVVKSFDGRSLAVNQTGDWDNGATAVLELGWGSVVEQYEPLIDQLRSQGMTVITHYRRAYDPVLVAEGTGPEDLSLATAARDLEAIVKWARERSTGRTLYVFGHSLGGEIVRRFSRSSLIPADVICVALDPSHVRQFELSLVERQTRENIRASVHAQDRLVQCGLGVFLSPPVWTRSLSEAKKNRVMQRLRSLQHTRATRQEFDVLDQEFASELCGDAGAGELIVVSAGRTLTRDPVMTQLHTDMATVKHIILDDCSHESIVANAKHARALVTALLQ